MNDSLILVFTLVYFTYHKDNKSSFATDHGELVPK